MLMEKKSELSLADLEGLLQRELHEHRDTFEATARMLRDPFVATLSLLEGAVRAGGKILLFGNGGSAADAQHIAAEFVIRYTTNRAPIAAIALSTDTSALTACGNDWGFDAIFERQVEALGRPQDVALGISTSGNSPNVLRGLRKARAMGLKTMGLGGGNAGQLPPLCDALIVVPSTVTARIQEMHITIGHILCKSLEQRLGLV
ncbi:MAG TPA: D-sedoheptulose 7-phosphate isomerase [Steroidobacteraceae bacterium]|nr:D-sedoheptulose 7-phosphate isomerase [Steroidobacteraceae bacterium]